MIRKQLNKKQFTSQVPASSVVENNRYITLKPRGKKGSAYIEFDAGKRTESYFIGYDSSKGKFSMSSGQKLGDTEIFSISKDGELEFNVNRNLKTITFSSDTTLTKTSTYYDIYFLDSSGGRVSITLPSAVNVKDKVYTFKKISSDTNGCSIVRVNTETMDGATTLTLTSQYDTIKLVSDGSNWISLHKDIISNDTDNRVITSAGTRTTNAEANLTFDGSTLSLTGAATVTGDVTMGWHGDADTIKILPSDFMTNDGSANKPVHYDDTTTTGVRVTATASLLIATVPIPLGKKATAVTIYDINNTAVVVYEANVNTGSITSKGTGNCNSEINITDVTATATNYLVIKVTTTAGGDRIRGGIVDIENA